MGGSCDFRGSSADEEEGVSRFDCGTAVIASSKAQMSADEQVVKVFSRLALKARRTGLLGRAISGERTTKQTIAGKHRSGATGAVAEICGNRERVPKYDLDILQTQANRDASEE